MSQLHDQIRQDRIKIIQYQTETDSIRSASLLTLLLLLFAHEERVRGQEDRTGRSYLASLVLSISLFLHQSSLHRVHRSVYLVLGELLLDSLDFNQILLPPAASSVVLEDGSEWLAGAGDGLDSAPVEAGESLLTIESFPVQLPFDVLSSVSDGLAHPALVEGIPVASILLKGAAVLEGIVMALHGLKGAVMGDGDADGLHLAGHFRLESRSFSSPVVHIGGEVLLLPLHCLPVVVAVSFELVDWGVFATGVPLPLLLSQLFAQEYFDQGVQLAPSPVFLFLHHGLLSLIRVPSHLVQQLHLPRKFRIHGYRSSLAYLGHNCPTFPNCSYWARDCSTFPRDCSYWVFCLNCIWIYGINSCALWFVFLLVVLFKVGPVVFDLQEFAFPPLTLVLRGFHVLGEVGDLVQLVLVELMFRGIEFVVLGACPSSVLLEISCDLAAGELLFDD